MSKDKKEFTVLSPESVVRTDIINSVDIVEHLYPPGFDYKDIHNTNDHTGIIKTENRYGVVVTLSTYSAKSDSKYITVVIARGLSKRQAQTRLKQFYEQELEGL